MFRRKRPIEDTWRFDSEDDEGDQLGDRPRPYRCFWKHAAERCLGRVGSSSSGQRRALRYCFVTTALLLILLLLRLGTSAAPPPPHPENPYWIPPETPLVPAYSGPRKTETETGIDLANATLYESITVTSSSTATVVSMATGYTIDVYQRFVGSLRKSGYTGHIIIGVAPNTARTVIDYLDRRNVLVKRLQWVRCDYVFSPFRWTERTTCAHPYSDVKIRWGRFPLIRDWIAECKTCTGPILLADLRDVVFQSNPFPNGMVVKGLQVFQEDASATTQHWLGRWPIGTCKGIQYDEPMLCSGTTIGTRAAMLQYLQIMYAEMKLWRRHPQCHFDIAGDDQSIHNYLFYSGQMPFATPIVNGHGTILALAAIASPIYRQHVHVGMTRWSLTQAEAAQRPYDGASGSRWIDARYNLTDGDGFFSNVDGSRSPVVHQWDRFGPNFVQWLKTQDWAKDDG